MLNWYAILQLVTERPVPPLSDAENTSTSLAPGGVVAGVGELIQFQQRL